MSTQTHKKPMSPEMVEQRKRYRIVRAYTDGRPAHVIRREVCLADAIRHVKGNIPGCVWQDGYLEIK